MYDSVRQEVFALARTVIVKVGSNVLARDDDQLDEDRIRQLSEQISGIREGGRQVVLVTSGAVAAGIGILELTERPQSLAALQAAAAAGQPRLMTVWGNALSQSSLRVAQILLTVNDFRNPQRYINVRNTIRTLLDQGIVPIVNENDTVSIDEITIGDNDNLAAMLATLLPDPLLIILSGVDGLLDGPPLPADTRAARARADGRGRTRGARAEGRGDPGAHKTAQGFRKAECRPESQCPSPHNFKTLR